MNKIALLIVTAFAAVTLFYRLTDTPPSLNWDEVSHGYNAYSILKTGKDEWGITLPSIFRAYGDYKLPLYIYLTTMPVAVLGLGAFSVRFISMLSGILALPGVFLVTNEIFSKQTLNQVQGDNSRHSGLDPESAFLNPGIIAAILLTLTPWHFFISRPALEANLCLTLLIYAFYFSLRALKQPNMWLPASVLWSLSLHTYNTARVFVPVFLFCFVIYQSKKILPLLRGRHRGGLYISLIILSISFLPIIYQTLTGTGLARYDKLSILNTESVYQIGQARLNSHLPSVLPKLIHNRPVYFATTVTKNYLSYFSPAFLYQTKDAQAQFAIPGVNLLGLPITVLFIIGLAFSLKRYRVFTPIYLWLAVSPLAAALTNSPPQALRPTPMIPSLVILAAFGLYSLATLLRSAPARLVFVSGILIFCTYSFTHYLDLYFNYYRSNYSTSWQYGYQQLFDYLATLDPQKPVIITKALGEPHEFYAFYSQLNPVNLQDTSNNIRFYQSKWWWTDKIGSIYFVNDWEIPTTATSSVMLESKVKVNLDDAYLVTTGTRFPQNFIPTKVIDGLNNDIVFLVGHIR